VQTRAVLPRNGTQRDTPPLLYDVIGTAYYTGLTPRTVQELRATGQLNAAKIGRRIWFRRSDLDAFIEARFAGSTQLEDVG